MKRILTLLAYVLFTVTGFSQTAKTAVQGWHLLDHSKDGYMGISLDKAYELLKGRKSQTVIVAVIDSGIDTLHEDLKDVLWTNPAEISGNGKDDDGNGYVDDLHGWNFCGGADGKNVDRNSHEVARVYHNWKSQFEGKKAKNIPADQKFLYEQWVKAAELLDKDHASAVKELPQITDLLKILDISTTAIQNKTGLKEFTAADLEKAPATGDEQYVRSVALWKELLSQSSSMNNTGFIKEVNDYKNNLDNQISRKEQAPEDFRGAIVKDRYTDINDRLYGNNNLKSGSGDHGTSVAGIIGATRNNNLGANGIADNVRIMAVRAVPGGDEHDKDVALAIRYAVDNGAKVINMSFGKPVSPYKHFVDDAVRYAATKGVLLVHGSGNDGKDISKDHFYPHPQFLDGTKAANYITVGASGDETTGGYAASFSNYSSKWVDIFAPGMSIYTTATDNRYSSPDGTSAASPVVSGVAALLKSYFPKLTPEQIVHILTTSGSPLNIQVLVPGEEKKQVSFSNLSSSGRVVNAYEAVKMAMEMEKGIK